MLLRSFHCSSVLLRSRVGKLFPEIIYKSSATEPSQDVSIVSVAHRVGASFRPSVVVQQCKENVVALAPGRYSSAAEPASVGELTT